MDSQTLQPGSPAPRLPLSHAPVLPSSPAPLPAHRRSFLAPVWAVARLQGYFVILQVRNDGLIAWLTAFVQLLVARQLWIALFNGRATYNGFTLDQTLTYMALSMALNPMLKSDGFIHWKIRSGNILFELSRPLSFSANLLVGSLISCFANLLTIGLPVVLMAAFLLKIPLPVSPVAWLIFAVSLLLGLLIFSCIDALTGLLGFWTTETHGVLAWQAILVALLSGGILPLWIFPGIVQQAISFLPFRGIQYAPLSILVGWINPPGYLRELAVQLFWVVILWLAVEWFFALSVRRYENQGG